MKQRGRRILIIVLSIMVIMTYMIPGSVFADTAVDSDEPAAAEVHEHDQASEELSEGDDGLDAISRDAEEEPAEDLPEETGEAAEVPEAAEAEEPAEEAAEEPAEDYPVVEETVTVSDTAKAAGEEAPAVKAGTGGVSVLAFTSDTHNQSNNTAANRLGTWLDKMADIYGAVDVMAFGGDMADAGASSTTFWTYTQADMDKLDARNIPGVYTTGNHEYNPGSYTHDKNTTTQQYKEDQQGYEGSNYRIYCLGSSGSSWNQYSSAQITTLTNYLNSVDSSKPIIIITHYPLHYFGSRTITNASGIIDALNSAADSGKKIVFLWGHNHTESDTNYDEIFVPGDTISYSSGNSKKINFYYGAAGCMSDRDYGTGSGSVSGKGLIITINSKNQLSFAYHNADGANVTENGNEGQGTALTEQDPIYATSMSLSAQTATVEVNRTLKPKLEVSFVPADTNQKAVTWSSSKPTVASVDANGKVKGLTEGTTTITATYAYEDTNLSASCVVTVVPRTSSDPEYVIRIGDYALSTEHATDSYSSGSWSTSTYSGMTAVSYTAGSGADDSIRWILEETDDGNGYYIKSSDDKYLNAIYTSSGSSWMGGGTSDLKLDDTPDVWTLDGDLDDWLVDGSKLKSANTDRYLAEVTGSAGTHIITVRSSDSAATTYGELASDPVAVTGVSVTPPTATVEARKTVQFTATVTPADATNKKVTWSSDTPSVATVDANGKVRGVSEGTAVITATSVDNQGITASATVTVTPSTSTVQHYVIMVDGNALTTDRSPNTANGGSSSYTYTGLAGAPLTDPTQADDNMRFILEETSGGYYIMDLDGNYLNATYVSGSNSGTGDLKLDSTPDVWVLDSGYSLDSGTVDGSKLKSTNASGTASSDKFLSYEDSSNLFSVRSSGNADEITIEEASDPVGVTGVTVSPKTATVEARKTVPLTATVAPADATNKKVTWSSSNPSVATVDENGKVRGVAEGTATITATTVDGGKTDTCAVTVTPSTSTETHYVIAVDGNALTYDRSPNTAQGGSSSYTYTGLAGAPYAAGDTAADNMRFIFEETEGGYYIKDLEGNYLNATYTSGSNSGKGDLKLDSTKDVWVLDSGYSLESGTVDGSKLKSTNASGTATSDKFLGYEESGNLFTVRSNDNADTVTIEEASDPVAVTGVTVSPKTATVEAKKTVPLTATVAPDNATNKKVTWSSSNPSVATVDENGKVKGVTEGTATITATTVDGGRKDTCAVTVTPSTSTETHYLIVIDGFALSTDRSPNTANGGSSSYTYTGLAGVAYTSGDDPDDNISWIIEETEGGYYIKDLEGNYLNATYTSGSNSGKGDLKLDSTPDVWSIEGTLEDWMVDGSKLKSANASATATSDKFLSYEDSQNLFSVRSTDNADESTLVDPSVTIEERFVETNGFENGKEYIIAVTKDSSSVYAVKNITGTSTGNTGSVTLTVTPASGSDPAYIVTDDEGVVWKYSSSNQYLTTSNSHYLGYESSSYNPRVSSQGRAIAYSGGRLTITSSRYLTCDNGTFGTSTSSSSAAAVRIFVKTVAIVECTHEYGEPTWTWTGNVKSRAAVTATATFTCTKCGETLEVPANVTSETDEAGHTLYTATVTGPDGREYTNQKYKADETQYEIRITADKATASPGDEITFTITLGPVDQFGSLLMRLDIPTGLTYVADSFTVPSGLKDTLGFDLLDWQETSLIYSGVAGDADYVSTTDTVLATFKCTVDSGYTGSASVSIKDCEFVSCITWIDLTELYDIIPAALTIGSHTHTMTAHAAVAATCTTAGNSAYWSCDGCGKYFSDAQGTTEIAAESWVISALGHNMTAHAATAATCTTAGNSAYWSCDRCGKYFSDAQGATEIAENSWVITATGHTMTAHAAVAATCTTAGNSAYWSCSVCGKYFSDAQGATEVAENSWVISALGHNMTAHAATEATCEASGNTAYWSCDKCGKYFSDAQGATEIAADSWVIAATGHDWEFKTFTWTETTNGCTAVANYQCKNDADHTTTANATVTAESTSGSCETPGQVVYTAIITAADSLDKAEHSATKTVESTALGHDLTAHAATAATCTTAGNSAYWKCERCGKFFSDELGTTEIAENSWVIAALGHNMTEHAATEATCEAAGNTAYWSCERCGKFFSDEQGTTEIAENSWVIAALGHDWQYVNFTWTGSDEAGYTAAAVNYRCKNDATHTQAINVEITSETNAATCEIAGSTVYTAAVTEEASLDGAARTDTKTVVIPAKNHDWGEASYTWAEDNSTATASRTCKNDPTHVDTETVETTSNVTLASTCTAKGETVYTATFTKEGFAQQTKAVETDMIAHTLVHHDEEPAQCEAAGTAEYWECSACKKLFSDAEGKTEATASELVIPATDHDWGEVSYIWADDFSTVKATRVCKNNSAHVETETVGTDYAVITAATETTAGTGRYTTKAFENTAFTEQTKDVEIPPTGYQVSYEWSADKSSVTGNAVPYDTSLEPITETVETTSEVTKAPTCTETGTEEYTAVFTKAQFSTQTEVVTLDALGHDLVHHDAQAPTCDDIGWAAYDTCSRCDYTTYEEIAATGHDWEFVLFTWEVDEEAGYTAVANYKCKNNAGHTQTVNATVTSESTPATCEDDGQAVYTATIAAANSLDKTAHSEDKTVVVEHFGHDWGEAFYGWSDDNTQAKAVRTCKNDSEHIDWEEVDTTSKVTVEPSCTAKGEMTYTATFTKEGFVQQTKTVEIDMIPHTLVHHDGVPAQCEAAGTAEYWECSVCKKFFSDAEGKTETTALEIVIPATGHTVVTDPAKPATCVETGLTEGSHCSVCGEILVAQEVIPLTQHTWGEPEMIKEPVYLTPGLFRYTCTVCGETVEKENGWVKTDEGDWIWRFIKETGEWAVNEWVYDNKGWCWIMEDGICACDTWFDDPVSGNRYYLKHGGYIALNEWINDGENWYFMDENGISLKSKWLQWKGDWYYLKEDGKMAANEWAQDSKGKCWMLSSGKMAKSKWISDGGEWYYMNSSGYITKNGWVQDSKGWCWMGADGKITKSKWIKGGGEWYYLKADGYMAASEWTKDSKGWMYMDGSGKITKSKWIKWKGDWYYLKADGYMATGTITINGETYKFDSSGKWIG